MKAFLLAAGLGTRLRPLTDSTPKCLLPVGGKPLLHHWFRLLKAHGISEVLLNLHHFPEQVRAYLDLEPPVISVRTSWEPELLGSAGTVRQHRAWLQGEDAFLVAYADNLTDADLSELIRRHDERKPVLTMGLFETDRPTECGIATLDAAGTIIAFEEKPTSPVSNLANAGIYVADRAILEHIPRATPVDFGHDVLPALVGRMQGVALSGRLIDIGTPQRYQRAQREFHLFSFPDEATP